MSSDLELDGAAELEALDGDDVETIDALPVLAEVRPLQRASPVSLPAVQAAAAAATGFVAGAATIALVRRHGARKLARAQRNSRMTRAPRKRARLDAERAASPGRRPLDMLPVVGSRTFLVDVHLLAKPGE